MLTGVLVDEVPLETSLHAPPNTGAGGVEISFLCDLRAWGVNAWICSTPGRNESRSEMPVLGYAHSYDLAQELFLRRLKVGCRRISAPAQVQVSALQCHAYWW